MAIPARGSVFNSIAAQILSLQHDLQSLDSQKGDLLQQLMAIQSLHVRCRSFMETFIPSLVSPSVTTPAALRQSARSLQLFLESLTDSFLRLLAEAPPGMMAMTIHRIAVNVSCLVFSTRPLNAS